MAKEKKTQNRRREAKERENKRAKGGREGGLNVNCYTQRRREEEVGERKRRERKRREEGGEGRRK